MIHFPENITNNMNVGEYAIVFKLYNWRSITSEACDMHGSKV